MKQLITGKETIGDVAVEYPEIVNVLLKYGLHCIGCHVSYFETLEDGARGHGMDDETLKSMLEEANKVANEQKGELQMNKKPVTEKEGCKTIEASYVSAKEWKMDPEGYFLIRVNKETGNLEVGLCKKDNVIEIKIVGDSAEKICNTVLRENITQNTQHIAYLGAELARAEVARELKLPYVQDELLDFKEVKQKLCDE